MMKLILISALICFTWMGCKEKATAFRTNNCKGNPSFVKRVAGFNMTRSFFSTSEIRKMGLVLVENHGTAEQPSLRYYQHPTWKDAGWLSPIQLDAAGNVYTSPAPFINTLNNPRQKQNTIYKVDAASGEMKEFIQIPFADSSAGNNPYGVLGLLYLCEGNVLYASTIAGSDRHVIRGGIYAIDVATNKVIDRLPQVDAIGMGISYVTGDRRLYFGTGRDSKVFSIPVAANGKFSGEPSFAFSLEGLGPRGDDKVRRIRSDQNGNLLVYGIEFNYNLIAPSEKPETLYEFWYDGNEKKWWCKSVNSKTTNVE